VPSESLDAFLDDRKPYASSRIPLSAVQALEYTEDPLAMLGGDADALVGDENAHTAVGHLRRHRDVRLRPCGHELEGVVEEIPKHVGEDDAVAANARHPCLDDHLPAFRAAEPVHRVADDVVECHGLGLDLLAREPAVVQQVGDERVQVLRGGGDPLGILATVAAERRGMVLEQRAGEAFHRTERRAEVVRDRIRVRLELRVRVREPRRLLPHPALELLCRGGKRVARLALRGPRGRALERQRDPVGGQPEDAERLAAERARHPAPDVEDADQPTAGDERDAGHGAHAALRDERIGRLAPADVVDDERLA